MQSVNSFAKQLGISPHTIYWRMLEWYGLKPWAEYTLEEIQSVSKKPKRAMKRRIKKNG